MTNETKKTYTVTYRLEFGKKWKPGNFKDISVNGVSYIPPLGVVLEIPDRSGRFGRVISVEKDQPKSDN